MVALRVNIDWVIPCRFIEVHENLGTLIGAGIDTFWVPGLPANIQIAMAIRLSGLPEELRPEIEHTGRNIIRKPDGSTLSEDGGTLNVGLAQALARPDWLQGVMMQTVISFEAAEEGTYTFEHIVDSSSFSIPLHVVQGAPPGVET
jgi:hypothetical protein